MTNGTLAIGALGLTSLAMLFGREKVVCGTARFDLIDHTEAYINVDRITWIREGDTVLKLKGALPPEIPVVLVYLTGRDQPLRVVHPIEQLADTLEGFTRCTLPDTAARGPRKALIRVSAVTGVMPSDTRPEGSIVHLVDGTELLLVEPCDVILPGMTRPCR